VADIFHEVEEDLRRDQAAAIWKKYGNLIIGAALVLVLAEAALAPVAADGGIYGVLARFRLAETAIEAGDKAKARGILTEIAQDQDADKALRDLATIQAALLELEIGKPETAADLVKDLTQEGEAYRLSALEITGLAALAAGDTAKARTTFETVKKAAASAGASGTGFVQRADQLLDRLGN
jgi:hypothetical protein